MNKIIKDIEQGFEVLDVDQKYKDQALENIKIWLINEDFSEYRDQLLKIIEEKKWDYLLDSFYQVIPFGTGGRRGEVGVGPNRINPWTIKASAQGHAQYLIKNHGKEAIKKGVVFAFDVREFTGNKNIDNSIESPIKKLDSAKLAHVAAEVYSANKIKVYIFEDIRTTPELSFAIRYLKAIAGAMFSASHNPPDHNGKKVYDQFGGQLIPPDDENLVNEVTQNVSEIITIPFSTALKQQLIIKIGKEVDNAYINAANKVSLSTERDVKIAYTPLHGCGESSVYKSLKQLGFDIELDPNTKNPSGRFENVTFNIPNPEVVQSFDTVVGFADEISADIILNSDPDADRIGMGVKHKGSWNFINGNEIASIITAYAVNKRKSDLSGQGTVIKTTVTTNLMERICTKNNLNLIGDLLIGFKYIGDEMNKLEKAGQIDNFLLGAEESHGYIAGNYVRDKDAVTAAIWLSELAAELKKENKTLVDFLDEVYSNYGYFNNYLTEIRLLGATGQDKIKKIMSGLRDHPPKSFERFIVKEHEDCRNRKPIVSETDKSAKNILIFYLEPIDDFETIKVTFRPSGTEPKAKMYFEIGTKPVELIHLEEIKEKTKNLLNELEKSVMKTAYKLIDVDFPDRGFLLFWQLPLDDKLKYFEIEPEIIALKDIEQSQRREKLDELLKFLGSDPILKIDDAFKEKYNKSINSYLELN